MKRIISHQPGTVLNITCLCLLLGQGLAIIFLVGYIAWVFSLLFFAFAIFPILALLRPERNYLEMGNGIMRWRYIQQGSMIDNAAVVFKDLRHVQVVRRRINPRKVNVQINLLTADGQVLQMPDYLKLDVNEEKILHAIRKACPHVIIEHKDDDA